RLLRIVPVAAVISASRRVPGAAVDFHRVAHPLDGDFPDCHRELLSAGTAAAGDRPPLGPQKYSSQSQPRQIQSRSVAPGGRRLSLTSSIMNQWPTRRKRRKTSSITLKNTTPSSWIYASPTCPACSSTF